jgi:phosphohistidine phosphatase
MMLYIMRHGLAEEVGPKGDDASRQLTIEGREKISAAAKGLKALDLELEVILTSPIPRAAETANLVAAELGGAPVPQMMKELSTGVSPQAAMVALKQMVPHQSVLIVGHEPTLSRVASLLLTGTAEVASIRLKQGSVIALELPERVDRGVAQLRWMMTQRHLRKVGK